jgi:uncharacterized protein
MNNISLLIKPASGLCNLRCRYCFYRDEMVHRDIADFGIMSEDTLRKILQNVLPKITSECRLMFQGGEPTLAGLDFFRNVIRIAEELNTNNCKLSYSIQTNGMLIDTDWCDFFRKHQFLVGLSLDGPKGIHDTYRLNRHGKGTYEHVMKALRLLQKHKVDVNILTVITEQTCRRFNEIDAFFRREGIEFVQYIPCLDPIGKTRGNNSWSLSIKQYEEYLKKSFDLWYNDIMHGQYRSHRYFDNLIIMLHGRMPEACTMAGRCGPQYVIEADGSVYPCDFYVLDEFRLGNLATDSLESINAKRTELRFIEQSAEHDPKCRECKWHSLCRGGCRRDRDYFAGGVRRNHYCSSYCAFFEYALPRLQNVYRITRGN